MAKKDTYQRPEEKSSGQAAKGQRESNFTPFCQGL